MEAYWRGFYARLFEERSTRRYIATVPGQDATEEREEWIRGYRARVAIERNLGGRKPVQNKEVIDYILKEKNKC